MIKSKYIYITFSALTIILASAVLLMWLSQPKVGYINLKKVYDDFELKKELDDKLISIQTTRQHILDSLQLELTSMSKSVKNPELISDEFKQLYSSKREDYFRMQEQFNQDNEALTRQYMEVIWKRINDYAGDFGKEHGYKMMVGGDGTGAVMYTSDDLDVTQDFLVYANTNYKGN